MDMELRQVYEQMQGNYDSVLGRLSTEDRIKKYLFLFMDKEMDKLVMDALDAQDYETAFRETHNLKGICANLNLDKLEQSVNTLLEELRGGAPKKDVTACVQAIQDDYKMTICAINNLREA